MCFLDASKAFDRVTHTILFRKLVERGVRGYNYCTYTDVLVLKPMYVCSLGRGAIAWFSCFECCSTGGILYPYLFVRPADQISVMSGFEIVSYSHSKPKYGVDIQFPFFTEMKCLASYLPVYLHANVINMSKYVF